MRRATFLPLVLVGLLAVAAGCSDDESPETVASQQAQAAGAGTDAATTTAPAAPAGGRGIVPVGAQQVADLMLQQGDALTVIDVRTPAEFAEGHIESAVNYDVEGGQFTTAIASLDRTKEYVVYCRTGRRSAIAAQVMIDAGFVTVYDLGALDAWAAAGFPVVVG